MLKDECYLSCACRMNYVCQIHDLGERERGI